MEDILTFISKMFQIEMKVVILTLLKVHEP